MSRKAIYVEGSIYKHLLTLTFLGMIGLVSRFLIDAINIYFVGKLPEKAMMIPAIGLSQGYLMLLFAICITGAITVGIRVGFLFGLGKFNDGKTVYSNLVFAFVILSIIVGIIAYFTAPYYLHFMSNGGKTPQDILKNEKIYPYALIYTRIMLISFPILMLAILSNSGLAIIGKVQINTNAMIISSIVDAVLTYILIIHFSYGLVGLAISNIIARIVLVSIVFTPLVRKKTLFDKVKLYRLWHDIKNSLSLLLPTFLSQLSNMIFITIANKFLMRYDPAIIAGFTAITKIFPLAYCFDFSLGGSFSTIFSQNFGAKNIHRLYETIKKAIILALANVIIITILLGLFKMQLIDIFSISPKAYDFFDFFVYINGYFYGFVAISNVFTGLLQNINKPAYATVINLLSATVGSIFFLWLFQLYFGAKGVLIGWGVNSLISALVFVAVGLIMFKKSLQIYKDNKGSENV